MNEPVYINEFDKPVFNVYNVHIKKVANSQTLYEVQFNDQYFQVTREVLRTLYDVTMMEGDIALSIG